METLRVRIDRVLSVLKVSPSRTKATQFVRDNMVLINDNISKPSSFVSDGDIVTIYLDNKILKFEINLEKKERVIYIGATMVDDSQKGPMLTC